MLKLKTLQFAYNADGELFSANTTKSLHTDDVTLTVRTEGDVFSASVHALHEIRIERLRAVFECELGESDRIFLNGYQSWTDSQEHTIHDKLHGLDHLPKGIVQKYAFNRYGDYDFVNYDKRSGHLHGWSYGYVRTGPIFRFMGSLSEDCGFTLLRTDAHKQELIVEKDCRDLHLLGDFDGLQLLLTEGNEKEVFDRYFELLGIRLRPEAKPIFGYTSWYRHYQNITSDIIREDLEGLLSQHEKADVFQIDDGYQTAVGDWLSVDADKFPDGMAQVASEIRDAGMLPGIWMAPFACEEKSEIFQHHKDWLLTDENGYSVKGGSNWSGFYALDIYNENVRSYLREVFRTVTQEWGYKLLKLDFLFGACLEPHDGMNRGELMADALDLLRESVAEGTWFDLCGVPLTSAFGRTEFCRIGCDVGLDWDDVPYMRLLHRERVSTKRSLANTIGRSHLDGVVFRNDPDVFFLRSDVKLTDAQRSRLLHADATLGGVFFTSDDASLWDDGQRTAFDDALDTFVRRNG